MSVIIYKMIFVALFLVTTNFLQVKAYEICNEWEHDEFPCYDTPSSIAFCCNYYDFDYHSCCFADEVWTLWYFWIGIILGIIFITAMFVLACRMCKKSETSPRSLQVATITQTTVPVSEIDQNFQVKSAEAPPPYDYFMAHAMPAQPYLATSGMPNHGQNIPYVNTVQQQPYYPPPASIPRYTDA